MPDVEVITYQFTFADGVTCEFSVELRQPSLELVSASTGDEPEWTAKPGTYGWAPGGGAPPRGRGGALG